MTIEIILLIVTSLIAGYKIYLITHDISRTTKISNTLININIVIKTKERQRIVNVFKDLRLFSSDLAIVKYADSQSFSKELVSCLPNLFLEDTSNSNRFILWKETKNLIPNFYSVHIIDDFCDGEVIQIEITNSQGVKYVKSIVEIIEKARLECPYYSFNAVLGVINQNLAVLEAQAFETEKKDFAEIIKTQRKELLSNELNLAV